MQSLVRLPEPTLLFGYGQAMEDPRDGLTLFGPLDKGKPYGIRYGVIGTKDGVRRFSNWVAKIQGPISNQPPRLARPPFPGFEAIFKIPWKQQPELEIIVAQDTLDKNLHLGDKHQRVYKTVEVFSESIKNTIKQEETNVDVWFVIIPDEVYKYCRPESFLEPSLKIVTKTKMTFKEAKELHYWPSLFVEEGITIPYQFEVNFHNQLKARLLEYHAPTQIIRESTIAHLEIRDKLGRPTRKLDALQSAIAWNLCVAGFYKAGGQPWKLGAIRDGVCYIGLVFKQDLRNIDHRSSCCAAQMFLDSGDGVVFKGAVGPWFSPQEKDFHLSGDAAKELVGIALRSYTEKKGKPPNELFLHGKVRFNDEEWLGFKAAVGRETNLVGVRIRPVGDFKLFRKGQNPVLRGLAYIQDERTAYLFTKGFVPRLQTYPGREVPNPLLVDVCRGEARIEVVLNDIMALTKLNYNSCEFADGEPVTLVFADAVGEILTAGPLGEIPPLPFKYYI